MVVMQWLTVLVNVVVVQFMIVLENVVVMHLKMHVENVVAMLLILLNVFKKDTAFLLIMLI